jgi:hypothetical protein
MYREKTTSRPRLMVNDAFQGLTEQATGLD